MKKPSFIRQYQDALSARYIEIVAETYPEIAALIQTITDKAHAGAQDRLAKAARIEDYIALWDALDRDRQRVLAEQYGKLMHLTRRVRVIGTTEIVWAHNRLGADTAGSIEYVIRHFRAQNVAAAQVQKFIDENALAWFSLTGHPTNPTTVAYTLAETNVARVLTNAQSTADDVKAALRIVRDTPLIGARKTPLQEAEETLNTMDVIFDATLAVRDLFVNALAQHGYDKEPVMIDNAVVQEGVRIRKPLLRPSSWTLGDGDGNDALTADVLEEGITLHRCRIRDRYIPLLLGIVTEAEADIAHELHLLQDVLVHMGHPDEVIPDLRAFVEQIKKLAQRADPALCARLNDFAYLVETFGFGYGTIDIRHNADDIMTAITCLAVANKLIRDDEFSKQSLGQRELVFQQWLADPKIMTAFQNTNLETLCKNADDKDGETAARVFGRLQVIGRHPDMCEKLIIAETTHAAHALAALILLRAAGNVIGTENSRIDLVTLSESVQDLVGIGALLERLLDNDIYRTHVARRGRLMAMIAKSDTTRQDGRGEAEYAQYEAAVDIYRVIDKKRRQYPELMNVLTSIKNGGGHALQRGGGRVTEVPALHGKAAADARTSDIGPSALTIQGQQQGILCCPGKTVIGTLEALSAQNLYSKAGVQGEMPPPESRPDINRPYARLDAWMYARTASLSFDRLAKKTPAIDALLVNAPWLSMKAGNASSRAAKRGEAAIEPGVTLRQARGDNPKALAGRAISGERLTAHSGLPVFTILGMAEAMKAVQDRSPVRLNPDKYGCALHHLYKAYKIHRDGARVTINSAAMTDFDLAWALLAGRHRPDDETVNRLAQSFVVSNDPLKNKADVTLAWLQTYFLETEKLTFEMVTGRVARSSFRIGDGLRILWPDLWAQVMYRNRGAFFARVIEMHLTRQLEMAPDMKIDEPLFRIVQAIYAAADTINAPVGILATRTRLEPARRSLFGAYILRPESYAHASVMKKLKIPPALKGSVR